VRGTTAFDAGDQDAVALDRPEAPFDLVYLDRQAVGDLALKREVLELFVMHSTRLAAIVTAPGEPAARLDAAHGIKGAARAIGAWPLARKAEAVEHALAGAAGIEPAAPLAALASAVADVTAAIGRYLAA